MLTVGIVSALSARQQPPSPDTLMGQALHEEEAEGNLDAAIATYKKVVADAPRAGPWPHPRCSTSVSRRRSWAGGKRERRTERIAREYADQAQVVAQARTAWRLSPPAASCPRRGDARQVWAGDDVDSFGMPSADGRLFAYLDWAPRGRPMWPSVTS